MKLAQIIGALLLASYLVSTATESPLTNSVVLLKKTNSIDGQLFILTATQRPHTSIRDFHGKPLTNYGSIVEIRNQNNQLIWNGWFQKSSPLPGPETNYFIAAMLCDSD